MTEKKRPHYDLDTIKATFASIDALRLTRTACNCIRELELTLVDVVMIIQGIARSHFYKSMTAWENSTIWQDVYHVPRGDIVL